MEKNIEAAVKLYSGDKPFGLFALRLHQNLSNMNFLFDQITHIFDQAEIPNYERLPEEISDRKKFADLFRQFNEFLDAANVQGFIWKKLTYTFKDEETGTESELTVALNETTYLILVKRYKELSTSPHGPAGDDIPYDITGYITTIDTDKIDSDYMNTRFEKYLKLLKASETSSAELQKAEDELHKTFATLSQDEQKYANIFLHDIQRGDITVVQGKTFKEYVIEYISRAKDDQIHRLAAYALDLDEQMLRKMMKEHITSDNINEYGRFDALKSTVTLNRAKAYFEAITGKSLPLPKVKIRVDSLLRDFILKGGYDIDLPDKI